MNLLHKLVAFAPGEEDPLTEVLAWFLLANPRIRDRLLEPFDALVRQSGGALPMVPNGGFDEPTVHTQLIAANPRGTACRYDLVCDWYSPRVRLIIEVKVWAGLTWGIDTSIEDEPVRSHQVARYLDVASGSPEIRTYVAVLAPYAIDLGFGSIPPDGFVGQVSWQRIHDAMLRAAQYLVTDATLAKLARDFANLLETKRMAAPKLTFDVLTSVKRYRQFEKSARMMLTHARDALVAPHGPLSAFYKGNANAWQDGEHDRMGWRVWVDSQDVHAFVFVGIHFGADTVHEEVPDLYLFAQSKKGGRAQKALEERHSELRLALDEIAKDTSCRVNLARGEWKIYEVRRSLVEVARAEDPTDATMSFFKDCLATGAANRLLSIYLEAVRAEHITD